MKTVLILKLMLPTFSKRRAGQTLVLVILAMAVSLAAGLAISSRSLSSLKSSSFSTQSSTAYHAAEAGAEEALMWLTDGTHTDGLISGSIPRPYVGGGTLTGARYDYSIDVGGGGSANYSLHLDKDKTQEIKLNGITGPKNVDICWGLSGDTGDDASIEMLLVTGDAGSGYTLSQKIGVNGSSTFGGQPLNNGFDAPPSGDGTYRHCRNVSWPGGEKAQLLRIKALYNNTSAVVKPTTITLPAQAFIVTSTGVAGESIRKLEVTKTLPALPEIFDFAIFTPADLTK